MWTWFTYVTVCLSVSLLKGKLSQINAQMNINAEESDDGLMAITDSGGHRQRQRQLLMYGPFGKMKPDYSRTILICNRMSRLQI